MDYQEYDHVRSMALGQGIVVTIDGPSGAGKSTVSRQSAAALDFAYLDTGAMYRACTWWCEHCGIDLFDSQAVIECVEKLKIEVSAVPHAPRILAGGYDVTKAIRSNDISAVVSLVSTIGRVRELMIEAQRDIIENMRKSGRGIVVEGRDIGTVVWPQAPVRILLTASQDVRLARRARNDQGSDDLEALEAEKDLVMGRDKKDSEVASFMEPSTGMVRIDTSDMSQHQALDAVVMTIGSALQ